MNKISAVGLDLAKNVFQVHAVDEEGEVVLRKQLKRREVLKFFARIEPCLIGIEACGGMHYWARELSRLGHTVRAIPAKFVKPYVKSNKNDANDAEAICEAVQRPHMRFAQLKSPEQQAVLHLHHGRQLLVRQRVALSNHIRGILLEYGIPLPQGPKAGMARLPELLEEGENDLPLLTRHLIAEIKAEHDQLNERIETIEHQIEAWHKGNDLSQRLATIPGIGLLTATALAAQIGEGEVFKSGRHLAAYLGLVPRQSSTGGKSKLLGISKRGDGYLRSLLVHGARAVIRHIRRRLKAGQAGGNPWVEQLLRRCHVNEVAVALANKMARMAWAVASRGERYRVLCGAE